MVDFAAEGLLDGLDDDARAERAELLRWMHDDEGFSLDELRAATEDGRLLFLPAGRAVDDSGATLTAHDVAQRVGLSVDFLQRLQRANGLPVADPGVPAYSEGDLAGAQSVAAFLAVGVPEEQVLAVARVLSRGLAQSAELMRTLALGMIQEAGQREADLARAYGEQVQALMPMVGPMLDNLMRLHLRHSVHAELINASERRLGAAPGARDTAVAFADLSGFTRLGERVEPDELERVVERLEAMTFDVVQMPVRVVKTLGDGVMLISPEAEPLVAQTIALVDAVDATGDDALPQLRAGLAYGPAVNRGGDYFGRPVNLASRVTGVARPGAVLAAESIKDAVGDEAGVRWSYAHARRLKGVDEPVKLFRARDDADG